MGLSTLYINTQHRNTEHQHTTHQTAHEHRYLYFWPVEEELQHNPEHHGDGEGEVEESFVAYGEQQEGAEEGHAHGEKTAHHEVRAAQDGQ